MTRNSDLKFDILPFSLVTLGGLSTDPEEFKIYNLMDIEMTETSLTMSVNFTDASIVSMQDERDKLQLTIKDPSYFQNMKGAEV